MRVESRKVVKIDYTLTNPAGTVIDTSTGGEPLPYLHGAGNIIPGLEAALDGKETGDAVNVTIQPDQAYGLRDVNLIQDVPRNRFPANVDIKAGTQFQANTPQGARVVTVVMPTRIQ